VYRQTAGARPIVEVRAKQFRQVQEPSRFELEGVEIHLFHKDGRVYDQAKSAKADFDMQEGVLFSDGEAEIVMGVDPAAPPGGRLLTIRTSGVRFESKTGKASTDRKAEFTFEKGDGSAVGAEYDPASRDLHLLGAVRLTWRGDGKSKPMLIEAGEAFYKEAEDKVLLQPWSRLTRDTLRMEGGATTVLLDQGALKQVDVAQGKGVQSQAGRTVEYASEQMTIQFAPGTRIQKIIGERNAKLDSRSAAGETKVAAARIEMDLDASGSESVLSKAVASGNAAVESRPAINPNTPPADTRILRSETIRLAMRAGGQEIEQVETAGAATIDFLPNRAGQPKRHLRGDQVWIRYASDNQIDTFRTVNARTRTDPAPKPQAKGKPPVKPDPPVFTWSRELLARFDPKTGELARLEQSGDFRYEEGERKAAASKAAMEPKNDLILLEGSAKAWDPTGSTDADRIEINQRTNDFVAMGNVTSTRQPESKQGEPGQESSAARKQQPALLSKEEILQARAAKMTSASNNRKIVYEGSAVAWQGANRVQADWIQIDRDAQVLTAVGGVISQFLDKTENQSAAPDGKVPAAAASKKAAPQFTVVRAPQLVYHEKERLAHYTGGAILIRENLTVKAREIRAYLRDTSQDAERPATEGQSSLEKAIAEGGVEIRQVDPGRVRNGFSEHAEYYVPQEKVILTGGEPRFEDSLKGNTRGRQLTWFARNDQLIVDGQQGTPAVSNLKKKPK
jgi:lipopolysaccharide export system protein LptA